MGKKKPELPAWTARFSRSAAVRNAEATHRGWREESKQGRKKAKAKEKDEKKGKG